MSQVISVSTETLQPGNSNLTLDTQSVDSELPFGEISQGLYKEMFELFDGDTNPGFNKYCTCCDFCCDWCCVHGHLS
ncbi:MULTISPECIES: hypothetical protein [unclassified Roseofilum]|uniref:hypothetical protein n=1 Tax=unclassified Roseofilum TaxID=2620099 RepID=UPI001B295F4A|nr:MULTISPECIES: hypothetical protein [unclassified Roseofilum]MBP0011426.1 hypothetical protein [Roseofilum sp. Belize Diploria]MBP0025747.1 hypothetical protein [Roseofilum sp. SID2]MBP0035979.1 hypothetical protein [Roseofilum sp. Belize BBD 4]